MKLSEIIKLTEALQALRLMQTDTESEKALDTAIEQISTSQSTCNQTTLQELYNLRKFFRKLSTISS